MPMSLLLCKEIKKISIGQNDESIYFQNNSQIKAKTSTDNARGARANIIVCDEYRMIDEVVLNTVIKKFLGNPRQPNYLSKPEYKHLQERNHEIYMSSAWYQSSWAYRKLQAYVVNFFVDTKKYFVCGLPYQLSIKEGLLSRGQVEDEMSETDFNEMAYQMEMETMWLGDLNGSFFKLDEINSRRKIKKAFLHLKYYSDKIRVPEVKPMNKRILSIDVALMGSTKKKKNDASAIFINDLIQSDATSYQSNFVYAETFEGLTTDQLGLIIMRYYYHYKCTDIVLDTNGLGVGVYDYIIKDQYDPETGDTYKALTCCNDDDMADRCKVKDAEKVVWSVKATPAFNNEICILLRNGIQNGKINFLTQEQESEEYLIESYKGFQKLTPTEQSKLKMPYIQTTMAEYELVKLRHKILNGNIKVYETSGMRKDRYSSLAYSFQCACQLEYKLKPRQKDTQSLIKRLTIRRGYV